MPGSKPRTAVFISDNRILETIRKQISNSAQKQFVLMTEGVFQVTINIDLSDDLVIFSDQNYDLGASLYAAREIVINFGDIAYDLICALGDCGAAYARPDRDASVFRRFSNVIMEHQRVAIDEVNAYPIIMSALLF